MSTQVPNDETSTYRTASDMETEYIEESEEDLTESLKEMDLSGLDRLEPNYLTAKEQEAEGMLTIMHIFINIDDIECIYTLHRLHIRPRHI
jgi:hypothetical protein